MNNKHLDDRLLLLNFSFASQVDQVVDVMRSNVNKVLERDVKLGELDARAENLEAASNSFATSAKRVRKKMWWENLKMKLIIGGVLLAILIIIITIIAVKVRRVTQFSGVRLLMEISRSFTLVKK